MKKFDSLLSELELLHKKVQQSVEITQIDQNSIALHHIIKKWLSFKLKAETRVPELELQAMTCQIETLVEFIKTSAKASIDALRNKANNESYSRDGIDLKNNEDWEDEFQFQFYATGKKLSEQEFQSSTKNILCLDDICGITDIPILYINISTGYRCDETGQWLYGEQSLSVNYSLDIDVNDESGEDGAPQPSIGGFPIHNALNHQRYPTLDELQHLILDGDDWDAWLGNDASEIQDNQFKFGHWSDNHVFVSWTGKYGWDTPQSTLRFRGMAAFNGITISVQNEGDEEQFFLALWDQKERDRFTKIDRGWVQWGEGIPDHKRFTFELI